MARAGPALKQPSASVAGERGPAHEALMPSKSDSTALVAPFTASAVRHGCAPTQYGTKG